MGNCQVLSSLVQKTSLPTNIRAERVKGLIYVDGVMSELPEAVAAAIASCL